MPKAVTDTLPFTTLVGRADARREQSTAMTRDPSIRAMAASD